MERRQRAGDKSEELSVRTDLSARTDNMDDSMLELASHDHNTDDGTLSDNDDNVSYGDETETLYNVEEEEEDDQDNDLAYTPQRTQRTNPRVEERCEAQDDSQESVVEDDLSGYGGADFHREEGESYMRELIGRYEENEDTTTEQYKHSLMQLNSKWQQILDQVIDEQEQQIESLVQERNENELRLAAEANGLIQLHEEEIASVKDEVMEQSQKIILQEMKVNAERERKYEEAFESRVEHAVEESKQQLSEEFDITLSSMKATQEEMEQRYAQLVKEAEVRVKDEVHEEANKAAESKISVFMMQFEDIKTQVVDLTMDIQTLEMAAESKAEDHAIELTEKNNEIEKLKANIDKRINTSKLLVSQMRDTHSAELEQWQAKVKDLQSKNEQKDAETSKRIEEALFKSDEDLKKAQSKIKELLSNKDQMDVKSSKIAEKAHAKALEDVKKAHQLKIEEMSSAESKNIENMQQAVSKVHEAEVTVLKKKAEDGNALLAKYESALKKEKFKMAAVQKEHDVSIQKLKRDHKAELERSNENMLQVQKNTEADRSLKSSLKKQTDEHVQALEKHKREIQTLKIQFKEDKAKLATKYKLIISEKETKISSLQTRCNEFTEKLKVKDFNNSKNVTELEAKISSLRKQNSRLNEKLKLAKVEQSSRGLTVEKSECVDEPQGALANLQRDVEAMKLAANKRSKSMNEKNNTSVVTFDDNGKKSHVPTTNGNGDCSNDGPMLNGKEEMDEQGEKSVVLPSETQLQPENEGKVSVCKTPDVASNKPTMLSSIQPLPNLSPITLGSPAPQRKPRKKNSRVSPISDVTPKQKSNRNKSPQPSIRSSSSNISKLSFRSQGSKSIASMKTSKSIASMKTPTIVVAPKSIRKLLTTPRRRRRGGSLSSCCSSITQFEPDELRLMILNVPITARLKKIVNFFKIELIDDPLLATHVVAGDSSHPMRRTWKLMTAFCVTPLILKGEWLEESYKNKELLSHKRYLLLNDSLAESVYSFSMKNTLREGNERRRDGGLLAGWRILICDNVAGNKAPKEAEFHTMIGAAGGITISKNDIPLTPTHDPTHVIVITSDPPQPAQLQDSKCQVAAGNGAGFFTCTWFFDCMMHQKLFGIRRGLGRL